MGEIANDIINGACCALCGQYFVAANTIDQDEYEIMNPDLHVHGYSVACKECWDENCGYEKATAETI